MLNKYLFHSEIEQIRACLFSDREYGRASVMIGSGFSRNARRASASTPDFPLWGDLALRLDQGLNPARSSQLDWTTLNSQALRLATEYSAYFGRSSLDNLLVNAIPDTSYDPGYIHELLLSLPWSDVFTTNYDTLLERASKTIHERTYDIILTSEDIPLKSKPRIVKLHGSFQSHRPFILTEEDYRCYPKTNPAFVNLVQESIMENVFCLLGFSGDDPNFLWWTGWVRDTLGPAAPQIFLVGILDLTPSQRRLLESRNVMPIDLGPFFPSSSLPASERHSAAIEWFLLALREGRPPNPLQWPSASQKPKLPNSLFHPIPPGPEAYPGAGPLHPHSFQSGHDELLALGKSWEAARVHYPGWIVAPPSARDILFQFTEPWIGHVFQSAKELAPPKDLEILFEINWRLETCMVPLFADWNDAISEVLERYNPFPREIDMETATITPSGNVIPHSQWKSLTKKWVSLVFAVIRSARESQQERFFQKWMSLIAPVVRFDPEWEKRHVFEECLYQLSAGRYQDLIQTMNRWGGTDHDPFWDVRRAALLVEISELSLAKTFAESALTRIRTRLFGCPKDLRLLSQEGWAMVLVKLISDSNRDHDERGLYRDRWEKLSSFAANPWTDLEKYSLALKGRSPAFRKTTEKKRGFDPGTQSFSMFFGSSFNLSDFLPAFGFIRLFEAVGLPMRCGYISMSSKDIVTAAKWSTQFFSILGLSLILRSQEQDIIKDWFTRARVASLGETELKYLHSTILARLEYAIQPTVVSRPSNSDPALEIEFLSRILIRLPDQDIREIFQLVLRLHGSPSIIQNPGIYSEFNHLWERLIFSVSTTIIIENLNALVELPMPDALGIRGEFWGNWPEPFLNLKLPQLGEEGRSTLNDASIRKLIENIRSGEAAIRFRSLCRLQKLESSGLLREEEKEAIAEAIWSQTDPDGMPSIQGLTNWGLLCLPEKEQGLLRRIIKSRLLGQEIPPDVAVPSPSKHWFEELLGLSELPWATDPRKVTWSERDVVNLLEKIKNWWKSSKFALEKMGPAHMEEYMTPLPSAVSALGRVVIPLLPEQAIDQALAVLAEIEQFNISTLGALPSRLIRSPEQKEQIAQKIAEGLDSEREIEISGALQAIYLWKALESTEKILPLPEQLFDEVVRRVQARLQPSLESTLELVKAIVNSFPTTIKDRHLEMLSNGLEHLLRETKIPPFLEMDLLSEWEGRFPPQDRPEFRWRASMLAAVLARLVMKRELPMPIQLIQWKEEALKDNLPEVRKPWIFEDCE